MARGDRQRASVGAGAVGDSASGDKLPAHEFSTTLAQVSELLALTADANPLHFDPAFAVARGFRAPIVPAGFGSALLMRHLKLSPEVLERDLEFVFVRPLLIGESFVVRRVGEDDQRCIGVLERVDGEACVILRVDGHE